MWPNAQSQSQAIGQRQYNSYVYKLIKNHQTFHSRPTSTNLDSTHKRNGRRKEKKREKKKHKINRIIIGKIMERFDLWNERPIKNNFKREGKKNLSKHTLLAKITSTPNRKKGKNQKRLIMEIPISIFHWTPKCWIEFILSSVIHRLWVWGVTFFFAR